MNPLTQLIVGYFLTAICAIGTIYGGYLVYDGHVKRRKQKIINESRESNKEAGTIQQTATGNDNTQAATTGDNSPIIFDGDYVAGNKTVNIVISDPALEAKVMQKANEQNDELTMKYPRGSAVFGVTQKGFIVPKGLVPPNSEIKWDTARILELTEDSINILVPNMIINTETNKGLQIIGQKVELPKKVNAKRNLVKMPSLRIQVEILGIDDQMVIVGIGFIPISNQENSGSDDRGQSIINKSH